MAQTLVKIQRGRFTPQLQVVRAWISAASATISDDAERAIMFIDEAIAELSLIRQHLKVQLKQAKSNG